MRSALEGSQNLTVRDRLALRTSVELGIREDGGDADVGRGLDVGVGLVVADSITGLAVDLRNPPAARAPSRRLRRVVCHSE